MESGEELELFPGAGRRGGGPPPPLAERMRPRTLDEVVGQDALVGPDAPLRTLVESGELPSLVLWGPPGSGKTTLARLLAAGAERALRGRGRVRFVALSAVQAGVREVRAVAERAARERPSGVRTVLFLDEIHRFHRGQQDALLPHVEQGTITLLGATTENPSFEVAAPLLSRCRVFTLARLELDALAVLVRRAASDTERGLGDLPLTDDAVTALAELSDGDARRALNLLEAAAALHRRGRAPEGPLRPETLQEAAGRRLLLHDRDREEHYNVVSALIKSLRASDPDAALYYLARMLEAGEDPLFVARRLVIFAAEDVGNAEPVALGLATSAFLAVERIGMPEGRIPLAQAVTFLACAPKSNASYAALERASEAVRRHGSLPVPLHLRNAPTPLLRELGYGAEYRYPHAERDAFVAARNLPDALGETRFYEPTDRGVEATLAERLAARRRRQAPHAAKPSGALRRGPVDAVHARGPTPPRDENEPAG